jgi:RNA 2',3'-cyclic 3'-phosphodiesterase
MRLFVAVDVDDRTRARVARLIETLRAEVAQSRSVARFSWIPPERLHLTLHFIGYVTDTVSDEIQASLRTPIDLAPFDLRFTGVGTFPSPGRPRVVWLGIDRGAEGLAALHAEVARRLEHVSFRRESRAFSPHLTLARIKDGGTRADTEHITRVLPEPTGGCTIDHVTLYESRLSPRGPTYTPLLVTPLARVEESA